MAQPSYPQKSPAESIPSPKATLIPQECSSVREGMAQPSYSKKNFRGVHTISKSDPHSAGMLER